MRNRYTQRPEYWDYTGSQLVRLARARQGDCLWCAANRGDNQKGRLAKWGKKVAKKHEYATGKKRNDSKFRQFSYFRGYKICAYYDAHFDDKIEKPKRKKQKMELNQGDARYMIDEYVKHLKKNRNALADYIVKKLNTRSWSGASVSIGQLWFGKIPGASDFSVYITVTRDKPYTRYLPLES